jgi:D-glycero-alpha-D-manno-heptose-7-phosphate kinase
MARAPMRISFGGGSTDIEPYASEYGGCVLSGAIQFYAQAIFPSEKVIASKMEKTITDYFNTRLSLKITAGIPQRGSLGNSSSCFVAGIKAVNPDMSSWEIAELAYNLERNIMGIKGGKQDQYMAAFGGLNFLTFGKDQAGIEPIKIPNKFDEFFILVYIGNRHKEGAVIIQDQIRRLNLSAFHRQKAIGQAIKVALLDNDMNSFGKLLNEGWYAKLQSSPLVSNDNINNFYSDCLRHGAIGGRLTGAGGGGYMLLMEHPQKRGELRRYLLSKEIPYQNIKFDIEGVKRIA